MNSWFRAPLWSTTTIQTLIWRLALVVQTIRSLTHCIDREAFSPSLLDNEDFVNVKERDTVRLLRSRSRWIMQRQEIQVVALINLVFLWKLIRGWASPLSIITQASCLYWNYPISLWDVLNQDLIFVDAEPILSDKSSLLFRLLPFFPELGVHNLVLIIKVLWESTGWYVFDLSFEHFWNGVAHLLENV